MTETIDKIKLYTPAYRDKKSAHIPDLKSYKEIYDSDFQKGFQFMTHCFIPHFFAYLFLRFL